MCNYLIQSRPFTFQVYNTMVSYEVNKKQIKIGLSDSQPVSDFKRERYRCFSFIEMCLILSNSFIVY